MLFLFSTLKLLDFSCFSKHISMEDYHLRKWWSWCADTTFFLYSAKCFSFGFLLSCYYIKSFFWSYPFAFVS
jgi:hypothetical protein